MAERGIQLCLYDMESMLKTKEDQNIIEKRAKLPSTASHELRGI